VLSACHSFFGDARDSRYNGAGRFSLKSRRSGSVEVARVGNVRIHPPGTLGLQNAHRDIKPSNLLLAPKEGVAE
jgi:hypothetical protein